LGHGYHEWREWDTNIANGTNGTNGEHEFREWNQWREWDELDEWICVIRGIGSLFREFVSQLGERVALVGVLRLGAVVAS
jgi:hypothetical protein